MIHQDQTKFLLFEGFIIEKLQHDNFLFSFLFWSLNEA